VECVDHIDTAEEMVVGMASGNFNLITLERQVDPQLMRYTAVHEAGHAWAFSILDQAAMDALVAQVGGTAWDGWGTTYRSNVTESFANAFASCRGYGSMDYLPMDCDVMDAALTAAATR
ncbi:MAG TPA: hypothetical protein VFE45_12895, partial [Coriobacteriia bacterium]|nr:hypothetical protein [Coriobacteriia bacterium]